MIFLHGYFEKNKLPKFTEKATMAMKNLNNCLMNSTEDLEIVVKVIKRHLEECRPQNSKATVNLYKAATGKSGGLYLSLKADDGHTSDAARIHYAKVESAVIFEKDSNAFCGVDLTDKLVSLMLEKEDENNE